MLDYTRKIIDRHIVIEARTLMTAWEFKDQVSRMLGFGPQYIKLSLANGRALLDNMHGLTLEELGIKNSDILVAERMPVDEKHVEKHDLIKFEDGVKSLVPEMKAICSVLFNAYKNKATGFMDREIVARYLTRCTR